MECFKTIINNSFEQLSYYYCVTKENYNKEGKFIGKEPVLNRDISCIQDEMLYKLNLENSKIINTFGLTANEYHKLIEEHMTSHKQ